MSATATAAVRRRDGDRGQSLVELAMVLPFLLLLLMGTIDLGRIIFAYIALEDAVQEGVSYASWKPADKPGIQLRVTTSSNHGEVTRAAVPSPSITCTPSNLSASPPVGGTVSVTASSSVDIITPIANEYFGGSFPISATFTGTNLKGDCSP